MAASAKVRIIRHDLHAKVLVPKVLREPSVVVDLLDACTDTDLLQVLHNRLHDVDHIRIGGRCWDGDVKAARMAGLREFGLRFRQVKRVARQGSVEGADLVSRQHSRPHLGRVQCRRRLAVALEERLDQTIPVHGIGDGTAHMDIVERRRRMVESQQEHAERWRGDDVDVA